MLPANKRSITPIVSNSFALLFKNTHRSRDRRTTRYGDQPVRLGQRYSNYSWFWSGSVRNFKMFLGPVQELKKSWTAQDLGLAEPLGSGPIGFGPWIPTPQLNLTQSLLFKNDQGTHNQKYHGSWIATFSDRDYGTFRDIVQGGLL